MSVAQQKIAPSKKRAPAKPEDSTLDVTWPIDILLDVSKRPMTGKDVERFQARHNLSINDTIYALCIQNSAKFNEVCRLPILKPDPDNPEVEVRAASEALPFTLELLIRLYDESPGHASWTQVTPQAAFDALYGSVAKDFAGSSLAKDVRLALYRRFTGAMGRSIYTAYRWVQSHGNAKAQVGKVFGKLMAVKDPREMLERLAKLMYQTRRLSLDEMYPMPSLEVPPTPRKRGPPKGSRKAPLTAERAVLAAQKRDAAKQARLTKKRAATKDAKDAKAIAKAPKARKAPAKKASAKRPAK